jgi:YVTN family beta-propeller protein
MPFIVPAVLICVALTQPGAQPATPAPSAPVANDAKAGPYHVADTFKVGGDGGWDYVAVDPDAKRLYVPRGTRVMVLESDTGKAVGEIPDTQGVHGVAIASSLGKGFTSNGRAGTVTVFDLKTLKVIQTVKAGDNPDAILFEPTTKRVFAFNGRSKDATAINAEDLTVAGTIPLGGKPEFGVVDEKGKVFVNIEDKSEIVRIDAQALKVEQRSPLSPGEEPSGLAIDPAHGRLYSVCSNQKMVVTDAQTGKVLASPTIGKGVDGAAFDPAGFALASNGEGNLTVVSTAGDKFDVVQTLTTAPRARTLVIDPKTRHIYLPTAEFEAPSPDAKDTNKRPAMKPGTFKVLVVQP